MADALAEGPPLSSSPTRGNSVIAPRPRIEIQTHLLRLQKRMYFVGFQKTLTLYETATVSNPVLMAVQTLGTTGTGGQAHLILARLDTNVSVF